jgi:hypothetical protein
MTITRLLIVLATISLSVASAQDQSRQSQTFALGTRKFDFTKPQGSQPPATYNFSLPKPGQRVATLNPDVATTCYTMRTYVANNEFDKKFVIKTGPEEIAYAPPARDGSQQSPTLDGNYTTCQPSSQFAVKKAIQTVGTGNDGK